MATLIKFANTDCGLCARMANYDKKVAEELGVDFVLVNMDDSSSLQMYLGYLMAFYPNRQDLGFPTYLIVQDNTLLGGFRGGTSKEVFRNRVQNLIDHV